MTNFIISLSDRGHAHTEAAIYAEGSTLPWTTWSGIAASMGSTSAVTRLAVRVEAPTALSGRQSNKENEHDQGHSHTPCIPVESR